MNIKPVWPWLFALAIFFVASYLLWRNWGWWGKDRVDMAFTFVMGGFITFMVAGALFGIGCWFSDWAGRHSAQQWEENWRGQMVSMRGADGVQGSISGGLFILSGHVESQQVYHYYYTSGSAFKPDSWTVDRDTFVYEEDRKDGEVVQSHRVFVHSWLDWFAEPEDRHRMAFHIPKGSLKQSFSLE